MTIAQDQLRKATIQARNESLSRPFEQTWRGLSGPRLVKEMLFAEERKWRFDFANPEALVAIEIQGGIWIRGGHSRGKGQIRDYQKHNTASILGWIVFYICCEQITARDIQPIIDFINKRLNGTTPPELIPNHFNSRRADR